MQFFHTAVHAKDNYEPLNGKSNFLNDPNFAQRTFNLTSAARRSTGLGMAPSLEGISPLASMTPDRVQRALSLRHPNFRWSRRSCRGLTSIWQKQRMSGQQSSMFISRASSQDSMATSPASSQRASMGHRWISRSRLRHSRSTE